MSKHSTQLGGYTKLNEEQLRILDLDVPSSAVELQAKDKVNHQNMPDFSTLFLLIFFDRNILTSSKSKTVFKKT